MISPSHIREMRCAVDVAIDTSRNLDNSNPKIRKQYQHELIGQLKAMRDRCDALERLAWDDEAPAPAEIAPVPALPVTPLAGGSRRKARPR